MKQRRQYRKIKVKKALSPPADAAPRRSSSDRFVSALRIIDRNLVIFFIILIAFLLFGTHITLNFQKDWPAYFQLQHLNPDAKLYYSLAQNIVDGTGYFDTLRNDQIIPPIGHPLLLALLCIKLGLSPATFSWLLLSAAFIIFAVAIRIYTGSNIFVVGSLWLYGSFFAYIRWLSANIEASIVIANVLLILSLALLYRSNFRFALALMAGTALAVHILIRPLYLLPTHFCLLMLLGVFLYRHFRKYKVSKSQQLKAWLVILLTAECLVWLTYAYSYFRYHDSRFVTGTYGAFALYAGNNIYLSPDEPFITKEKYPEEFWKILHISRNNPAITWQQRHKIMTNEVINYWKKYPLRALAGWWWRFRQFLGICSGNFAWKNRLSVLHTFTVSSLLILSLVQVIAMLRRKSGIIASLGFLCAILFFVYSGVHAIFAYCEFRYVTVTIPLLVAADVLLVFDVLQIWSKEIFYIVSSDRKSVDG